MSMASHRSLRVAKMNSLLEELVWTYRVAQAKHPFPQVLEDWDVSDLETDLSRQVEAIYYYWNFLGPFFAPHGYTIYVKEPGYGSCVPAPLPLPATESSYPYSRKFFTNESPPRMDGSSPQVWAARDQLGREVIIKVVSELNAPTDELRILQRLNEKDLRHERYNHTIPVIEYLTFDNFIFVVMARWDCATNYSFDVVFELMQFTESMLEAVTFLHRHRIVHHDPCVQNVGMNAVCGGPQQPGLRDPSEVQYTLFDFGHSVMYPPNTDLDKARTTRRIRLPRGMARHKGPYNPFKADVAMFGGMLQERVRHLENFIPELGPFFDRMMDDNEESRFSAQEALSAFLKIYNSLSRRQLEQEVTTHIWKLGGIVIKKQTWK